MILSADGTVSPSVRSRVLSLLRNGEANGVARLKTEEVCRLLNVSPATFRNGLRTGRYPFTKIRESHKAVFYAVEEVQKFLRRKPTQ